MDDLLFADPADARRLAWGCSHLVFEPSPALTVISPDILDTWLDCSLLRFPFFTVVFAGEPVSPDEVSSVRIVGGQPQDYYIDGGKVRSWLSRGATLMVANLHEWHAPAQRICRELAEAFAAKVGAIGFWTAAQHRGLRVHRDDCHVIVVQVVGRKRWFLYDVPTNVAAWAPGYSQEDSLPQPTIVDLEPGQALYVPQGQAHAAESLSEASLHVSFTVREPRLRDAIALAVQACIASIPEHAPLAGTGSDRRSAAAHLLQRVARALGRVDTDALVASVEKRAINTRGSL